MSEATELVASDLDVVAAETKAGDRFLLTTHENPDGDALGSLLATHRILEALGKDSVMFLAAKEFPLPVEYRFLPLEEVFHEPPADIADRVVGKGSYIGNGPYNWPSARINARSVLSHTLPSTAFRGFGNPQINWAVESNITEAALQLGIDPLELRLRNLASYGDKFVDRGAVEVTEPLGASIVGAGRGRVELV